MKRTTLPFYTYNIAAVTVYAISFYINKLSNFKQRLLTFINTWILFSIVYNWKIDGLKWIGLERLISFYNFLLEDLVALKRAVC